VYPLYSELARFWNLISPLEDYAEEAAELVRVIREARPQARTLLELGSGGGHNAFYLRQTFAVTLTDISAHMLEQSRKLNPHSEHLLGDMRTLDLGREFDVVFAHDAVDYLATESDLHATAATARRHCRSGGIALFVPDHVKETFEPGTEHAGCDGADGVGVRYIEWTRDADPEDNLATTDYAFLIHEAGRVRAHHETHTFGLFPLATWLGALEANGFRAETVTERTTEARTPRVFFLGRKD
jgi:SAM-dependent methyltransferase